MSTESMNVGAPALEVRNLDVYYGRAHALQDISLTLHSGVLGVVGRNGMGRQRYAMPSPDWCLRAAA